MFSSARSILGAPGVLGVTTTAAGEVAIEPYTSAVWLADLGLRYVNEIAEGTDVSRLLPAGVSINDLPNGPPEDNVFASEIRRRIDALG